VESVLTGGATVASLDVAGAGAESLLVAGDATVVESEVADGAGAASVVAAGVAAGAGGGVELATGAGLVGVDP
jgi:hypothetical protein